MTRIIRTVAAALDKRCRVSGKLKKKGCSVSLVDAPQPRLVVDFDKPGSPLGKSETRCDYLFVASGDKGVDWIAPLELKRGSLEATEVVQQLRAGARVAQQIVSSNEQVKFRPTAAFRNIHKAERDRLRDVSNRVQFHGRAEAVRLIKCGDSLKKALGS